MKNGKIMLCDICGTFTHLKADCPMNTAQYADEEVNYIPNELIFKDVDEMDKKEALITKMVNEAGGLMKQSEKGNEEEMKDKDEKKVDYEDISMQFPIYEDDDVDVASSEENDVKEVGNAKGDGIGFFENDDDDEKKSTKEEWLKMYEKKVKKARRGRR